MKYIISVKVKDTMIRTESCGIVGGRRERARESNKGG
jgi:hypothetical protein